MVFVMINYGRRGVVAVNSDIRVYKYVASANPILHSWNYPYSCCNDNKKIEKSDSTKTLTLQTIPPGTINARGQP